MTAQWSDRSGWTTTSEIMSEEVRVNRELKTVSSDMSGHHYMLHKDMGFQKIHKVTCNSIRRIVYLDIEIATYYNIRGMKYIVFNHDSQIHSEIVQKLQFPCLSRPER